MLYVIIVFMITDYNPDTIWEYAHLPERKHIKRAPKPNYALRRGVALAIAVFAGGGLVATADHALARDQEFCTVTTGADTAWNNGNQAMVALRSKGASIPDVRDIVDKLAMLPNNKGIEPGIGVCAEQTTGIIGSVILGPDIRVQP